MKILSIETSCDETSVAILEAKGDLSAPDISFLSHKTLSQIEIHKEFGGVFPNLAKREHQENLLPLCLEVLKEAKLKSTTVELSDEKQKQIETILEKNGPLAKHFFENITSLPKPDIEAIGVTFGPGLEPALWVGINFAKALGALWDLPVVPINHMEGHIASILATQDRRISKSETRNSKQIQNTKNKLQFPMLALLVSGGHTELILVKKWGEYELIGRTRDDAVGEAFDKVARILGLPYPGGPQISALAEEQRFAQESAERTRNNAEKTQKGSTSNFLYKDLTYKIRAAIFEVRKELGLGHKEDVYHKALEKEFQRIGLKSSSEKRVPIKYKNENVGLYRPDFVIEDKVLIELKALPNIGKPQEEQIWSYLKGSTYKLALLVNFGGTDLQIRRVVYDTARNADVPRHSASSLRDSARQSDGGKITLPRPMLHSGDYDFSFSGLKTAVLYATKDRVLSEEDKKMFALDFENAVTEVLIAKTKKAIEEFSPGTLIVAGGVSANKHIRSEFEKLAAEYGIEIRIPKWALTTDNAAMISIATYIRLSLGDQAPAPESISASGTEKLA